MTSAPVAGKSRSDPPHPRPGPHVGAILVTRGRHAGKRLDECPPDFLAWLATSSTCATYRAAAAKLLGLDPDRPAPPRPAPPDEPTAHAPPPANQLDELLRVLIDLHRRFDELEAELRALRTEVRALRELAEAPDGIDPS